MRNPGRDLPELFGCVVLRCMSRYLAHLRP
jgi:hypothetical protein